MNRGLIMKAWPIIAVLITCLVSIFLLRIDSKSEKGILNTISMEKVETSNGQDSNNFKKPKEDQNIEIKNSNLVANKEELVEEKSEVATTPANPPSTIETEAEPFIIVIDPGHQAKANLEQEPIGPGAKETKYKVSGGTTGAVTKNPEYVLTLEASNLLKSYLENRGFQVILTRTSHNVSISNRERAEIANKNEADLFVRIHADGSESPGTSGFSILVPAKENAYTAPVYEDSYRAAQMVLTHISKEVPLHQNGIFFRNDMAGFNWSKVPVILPEIGFMTNPEEDKKLSDDVYLANLMELLASGIEEYANFKQKQKN